MSEPKRYTFEAKEVLDANGMVCFVGVSTLTHPMGKYVAYEDYARLKAEVERLTKAGDAMLSEWSSGDEKDAKNFLKALVIWNAAKEGETK